MSDAFTPHHARVVADGAAPSSWLVALHGIYGSGGNWRSFARKLVARRPEWGVVLVDLRMHGRSQGAPPPHTLAAAASDVVTLIGELGAAGQPVRAVSGHSYGGKVALLTVGEGAVESGWILDASPQARPRAMDDPKNTVVGVLTMLESMPIEYATRDEFVDAVVAHGHPRPMAQWLAMNLERRGADYVLGLELAAMRALLASYYASDVWPLVEAYAARLRFVLGGASNVVRPAERARLESLVHVDVIEGAGHWVHVDALDRLVDLFATGLS